MQYSTLKSTSEISGTQLEKSWKQLETSAGRRQTQPPQLSSEAFGLRARHDGGGYHSDPWRWMISVPVPVAGASSVEENHKHSSGAGGHAEPGADPTITHHHLKHRWGPCICHHGWTVTLCPWGTSLWPHPSPWQRWASLQGHLWCCTCMKEMSLITGALVGDKSLLGNEEYLMD